MSKEDYFKEWLKVIDESELCKVVNQLNILYKKGNCEPAYNNIFKVFNVTPYKELCVVMLGQDVYPQKNIATGIAFANSKNSVNLSPSLQAIKESVINFEIPHNFITFDPSLEEWSNQGILLLNSALTVERYKPGSHLVLWRDFIRKFLLNLSAINPGLIYVLWGSSAKSFKDYIGRNNIIHIEKHPSYYTRTHTKIPYKLFTDIELEVYKYYGKHIKWYNEIKM